ncbi:MAG: hypothetical protein ACQ5SW_08110 [Sphaerochaetaceae bacterium]
MNRRIRTLLIAFFLICILFPSVAAEKREYSQALGVQVGNLSGTGASYQRWTDSLGYQVAGGLVYHPEMEYGRDQLAYTIGFEVQYPLVHHQVASWLGGTVYLVGGIQHQGYKEAVETSPYSGEYTAGPFIYSLGLGGGVGVETILFNHFAIGTEFVYIGMYEPCSSRLDVDMYPQISLRYRF